MEKHYEHKTNSIVYIKWLPYNAYATTAFFIGNNPFSDTI